MKNRDKHMFSLARELSFKSDYSGCGRARIGCVIALNGTVIAKGYNTDKTHTMQDVYNKERFKNTGKYLPSKLHAEISCLRKIKFLDVDFSKIEVYIYRELKDGTIAMARPCPSCMAAIKDLGIRRVHYTTADGYCSEELKEM